MDTLRFIIRTSDTRVKRCLHQTTVYVCRLVLSMKAIEICRTCSLACRYIRYIQTAQSIVITGRQFA